MGARQPHLNNLHVEIPREKLVRDHGHERLRESVPSCFDNSLTPERGAARYGRESFPLGLRRGHSSIEMEITGGGFHRSLFAGPDFAESNNL